MFVLVAERAPSVAIRFLVPAVFKVAAKVPTPLVRVPATGRFAAESEDVNPTLPL